jgi:hypothetical protein
MRSPSLSLIPLVLSPEVRQSLLQSLLRGHKVSPVLAFEDLHWGDAAVEAVIFAADEAEAWAEQERRERRIDPLLSTLSRCVGRTARGRQCLVMGPCAQHS